MVKKSNPTTKFFQTSNLYVFSCLGNYNYRFNLSHNPQFFSSQGLLTHPLCKALLRKKWKDFGRYFYYGIFIGYVIFLAILTTYGISFSKAYRSSISTSENKTEEKETHFQFCNKKQGIFNAYEIFIIVFSVVFLIFEIIQFIRVII